MNKRIRRAGVLALALALVCSLLGCRSRSSVNPHLGKLHGKITYKSEPLPGGFLHFYNGPNPVGVGVIKPDGSGDYEAAVPEGTVQILVTMDPRPERDDTPAEGGSTTPPGRPQRTPRTPPLRLALRAEQAKLMDEVQRKYGSLKTAKPLTYDVKSGEQTWDINLD